MRLEQSLDGASQLGLRLGQLVVQRLARQALLSDALGKLLRSRAARLVAFAEFLECEFCEEFLDDRLLELLERLEQILDAD